MSTRQKPRQKLAFQVTRVTRLGEENAGLYFDRLIAEDRLGWWEKRHEDEHEISYKVDDVLIPEDHWERLKSASYLCDPVAIIMMREA